MSICVLSVSVGVLSNGAFSLWVSLRLDDLEIISTLNKKKTLMIIYHFVTFKPLSYCFEEIIGFDAKGSFASRPVSRLIKPGDITREF